MTLPEILGWLGVGYLAGVASAWTIDRIARRLAGHP